MGSVDLAEGVKKTKVSFRRGGAGRQAAASQRPVSGVLGPALEADGQRGG